MNDATAAATDFLNRLEAQESRMLAWGFVDGSFEDDEIAALAEDFLNERELWGNFPDPMDLVDYLLDRRLLFSFIDGTRSRYRTRMGEAIRLLARLRQLFPQHRDGRKWQQSKTLVADFRFILRPRLFPRRNVSAADAGLSINEVCQLNALQKDVLAAILFRDAARPVELAEFQVRATRSILASVAIRQATGSIVCAGTGSGKTLSFYLPAFLHLAPMLDESRWTRCLAIYPRKELLKDQLSETYRQSRRIDQVLKDHHRRKLTIGALFGDTPKNGRAFNYDPPPPGWRKLGSGFACPLLRCPDEKCTGDLVWKDTDRNGDVERLVCCVCGTATAPDELILTRDRLLKQPPDILFTTTEMLNQRLGDSLFARLFGVGTPPAQKPPLVLLDEVHTYAGVSGAQVALLLRRWKHAARVWPHFVGLSATLTDARRFFARLIGVDDFRVDEISPHPSEMARSGAEYLLAVRGDPASGASLLSTTIQTAMLMRRVQDASDRPCSEGLYGTRQFVFTDDLDVTNRLYFNLLDAEGLDSWGRPNLRKSIGSLANLRSSDLSEQGLRQRFGQSWRLCEEIGHTLRSNSHLRIGRTSSQDAGVATGADVIVATASLEVGFNDPEVNVVLQHKSPRDPAQFLQRKGRAGRRTTMRPWTVVVLSDYGRDRLTWQSYDMLFDPELPPRDLPVGNRSVLRMQAVFAFMDWIADQFRSQPGIPHGRVWEDFASPPDDVTSGKRASVRRRQQAAAAIVEELLTREERRGELSQYLQRSLAQDEGAITALMWDPPRALMTAVLPTLLRRLKSGWKRAGHEAEGGRQRYDYFVPNSPLPEFIPGQLFSDLNLPEVSIVTPPQERNDKPREEFLAILQAMKEFAPGRVSRRFGILNQWARHWIALPDLDPAPVKHLPLVDYVTRYDELGHFQYYCYETQAIKSVRCVRPYALQPQQPPSQVHDTSNAFLIWQTQIVPRCDGICVDVPSPSRWDRMIRGIEFFTHCHHSPLEIRRFSMASEATVKLLNGTEIETRVDFVDLVPDSMSPFKRKRAPVAVGFAVDADGVVFRFSMPDDFGVDGSDPALVRGLRTALFRDRVIADSSLDGIANSFLRQWLAEVYVAAIVESACASDQMLSDIWKAEAESNFDEVLQITFQSIAVSRDGGGPEEDDSANAPMEEVHQKLFNELSALLRNAAVVQILRSHAPILWQDPNTEWADWLGRKFKTTLGAAILIGIQQVCPDIAAGDLTLDIDPGPRSPESISCEDGLSEVWLTERTVGGGGIIENFLARYGEDPRRFFDLVDAALKPSDFEIADEQLTVFLEWLMSDEDATVREAVGVVRTSMNDRYDAFASALQSLIRLLSGRGLFVCHAVVTAIATRILKPGSNPQTDRMLHRLIHEWHAGEERLGIEIESRVFASQHARNSSLDTSLGDVDGDPIEADRRQWRFSALMSVLWPRGSAIRSRRLSVYNPFAQLPSTEPMLVRNGLPCDVGVVDVAAMGWRKSADELLIRDGTVTLRAPAAESRSIRSAILSMIVDPVDLGFMLLHPRVRATERETGFVSVTLELSEAVQ
jgi:hypothetical protein